MEKYNKIKIAIIGGGAAGMMAALFAKDEFNEVVIFEKNNKLGKKIYITGKGRCNITNASDVENHLKNCLRNRKFMYSAYYSFDAYSVVQFLNEIGLKTKTERGNRVYPQSDKASDVVKYLQNELIKKKVDIRLNTEVISIKKKDKFIITTQNEDVEFDKVIVATGGASYQSTGSDGAFFNVIKKLGHKVIDIKPSLVPFITEEDTSSLAGLTLTNVELSIEEQKIKRFGDLLFTHRGISGPIVLQASALLENTKLPFKVKINFKPAISSEILDKRLLREFDKNLNKNIYNVMKEILPQKVIEGVLEKADIEKYDKVNSIDKQKRKKLIDIIQGYELTIQKTSGFEEAVITRGGVDTKEIDPHTMRSKIVNGLYFAGEVIDIDSMTGGYNLQLAWSTAYLSGISAK